jgi:uncharacterized membrane protein YhaH (DUF805 family)
MHYYFVAWRRAFDFSGRSTRPEFWFFILFNMIAVFLLALFFTLMGTFLSINGNTAEMPVYVFGVASLLPALSVSWRRLHDRGISGWWNVAPLGLYILLACIMKLNLFARGIGLWWVVVPYALHLALYVICALDGAPGPNRFGPDPKHDKGLGYLDPKMM